MTHWMRTPIQLGFAGLMVVPLGAAPARRHQRPPVTAEAAAVFAGGCFWGVEAVFKHLRGVRSATSGFSGGTAAAPSYEGVSTGQTGHAESVRVVYDPAEITYRQLLEVFFTVAHNPTQRDRQGPDAGPEYRAIVFYADAQQRAAAEAYVAELERTKAFPRPIVTEIRQLGPFYPAGAYHQGYAARHSNDSYIVINDAPKVEHLRQQFPSLYRDRVAASR
ncbi:MAG: peptide-methionine (S)-S-oxide reductase MsrA [Gemmatimonadota bacterium]